MSEGEKRCEACGEGCAENGGLTCKEFGDHPEDIIGSFVCFQCRSPTYIDGDSAWESVYARIRTRRRSAQPAVASEFRDVDHVEVRVGDWLTNIHDGTMVQVGWLRAERPNAAQPGRALKADGSPSLCRMAEGLSYHWRKSAAPPGGEKAKDCDGNDLRVGDWAQHRDHAFSDIPHQVVEIYAEPRLPGAEYKGPLMVLRKWFDGKSYDTDDHGVRFWRKAPAPDAKTPGGSADAATEDTEKATGAAACASAQPPGSSLAAFTAAVHEHLLPRLPKELKVVTDVGSSLAFDDGFVMWVLDENGKELHTFETFANHDFATELGHQAYVVAEKLMARMSRAAEKPTEPGFGRSRQSVGTAGSQ